MKKSLLLFLLLFLLSLCKGQENVSYFKTIKVDKKIKDFPDTLDLSSPLNSCVTFYHALLNGRDHLLGNISTLRYRSLFPDSTVSDSPVSDKSKSMYLETTIKEIIYYGDSTACAISKIRDSVYSIRPFYLENGKWVQGGENRRESIDSLRQNFQKSADSQLKLLRRIEATSKKPADAAEFIKYLKENGQNPKDFLLSKLKKYEIVLYGEIHRRKSSWEFLQEVANDKRFAKNTGVIFMEMASHKQKDIDRFMSNDTIDKELLLNVFREYIDVGWNDKGMFDFIQCIWLVNRKLPTNMKIKIIAADTPRPFSTFLTKEAWYKSDAKFDRNEFMATSVSNYLESSIDKRNGLFIVGTGHVCKTIPSLGAILNKQMPHSVYSIFQHSPRVEERAKAYERIRHGFFDLAFYKTGDQPIAFELKNSPFGKEPFDGLSYEGSGMYQDNYDGYIFFGSLDKEPIGEVLFDLYSDNFIIELERRAQLLGYSIKDDWGLKELTRPAVIEQIIEQQTKTRWENKLKPLIVEQ